MRIMRFKFSNLMLLICSLMLMPYARASDPTILELRVMQSRIYETSIGEFLSGMKEACKSRGGNAANLKPDQLINGLTFCSEYRSSRLSALGHLQTIFHLEAKSIDQNKLQVRMYAKSFVADGPGRQKVIPVADKKIYELIFKDISDAIGLKDIPVQVNMAE